MYNYKENESTLMLPLSLSLPLLSSSFSSHAGLIYFTFVKYVLFDRTKPISNSKDAIRNVCDSSNTTTYSYFIVWGL